MNDIAIINHIEKFLKIKLDKLNDIKSNRHGYTLNNKKQVISIGFHDSGIDNNKLFYIISILKDLKSLANIDFSSNKISHISPLEDLKGLTQLWLYKNQIIDISPLKDLINLTQLWLYENQINDISPLKDLKSLKKLDLASNQISDISPLKDLKSLTQLWLYKNQISDISPLKDLKSLTKLDLGNNLIEKLPIWITDFNMSIQLYESSNNGYISFLNNPLKTPPLDIVKQGKESIIRYFEKIGKEGVDYIYEAKLILVGEGASGKTSLQLRLMDPLSELPKEDERTRGIKIEDWNFKNNAGKKHIAHIWDFGGQDVYYPVHRFFLTADSVFVLLASTRMSQHNFEYWIPTIFQFGGNSPIILGQTCHKGNKVIWNDIGYFLNNTSFNIVRIQQLPYHQINLLKNNEGLVEIKETIIEQLLKLPHYGKGVPKSWIPVRKKLADLSIDKDCISYEKFIEICKDSNPERFSKLVDIEDCARFFHSIGVILWYHNYDELRNSVILNPEWAMNAVYRLIDDDDIQLRHGIIIAADFNRLWFDKNYRDHHIVLKKMLEVFRIAFHKKHKEEYIIPARLLSIPDKEKWDNYEPYLCIEYKYDFMPRGIINQLSAELSRYIVSDNHVWNNAVKFCLKNNTAQSIVEEDFYNRKILIKAIGIDARALYMLIMDALKNITDSYKGVIPEIYVPCNCEKCRNHHDYIQTFSYNMLLNKISVKEKASVVCNVSDEKFYVEDLLFNRGLSNPVKEKRDKKQSKIKRIFIASSFELKNDRRDFELAIRQKNDIWIKKRIYLEPMMWENFIDAMSSTRLQDEYNKTVKNSDIFVMLFFTKVGIFTDEEFEKAFGQFKESGKPLVYTYFKNAPIHSGDLNKTDSESLFAFQEKLKELGHFKTEYKNIEGLILHFFNQLEKLEFEGKL